MNINDRQLTERNTAHFIINGCYIPHEIDDEAIRSEMLYRISKEYYRVELELSRYLARSLFEKTGLSPYQYKSKNAVKLDNQGYIWARNLLAHRLYDSPVIYLEPWTANSKSVYEWALLGDYDGKKIINGDNLRSLPSIYADFVVDGLTQYYNHRRD